MDYQTIRESEDRTYRVYEGEHVGADVLELDDDAAYIERIDVDEGFRGQGIGSAFIRGIRRDFRTVYAAPDNEDSARLFARLGEKVVGDDVSARVPEYLYYLDQGFGVYEVY